MTFELPIALQIVFAAAFGGVIGSFLNVCIYRLPLDQSIVWPGSACPHCRRHLSWYENIPVVSFAVLGGRCRTCREPIGVRYPVVEALTAAMFAAAWWYYGPGPLFASRLLFGCALIVLFAIDLEHHLLPNVITLPGIVVGFAFSLITEPGWASSLLGILFGGGLLYAMAEAYYLGAARGRPRHGGCEDAGDGRRVPRLEAHGDDADAGVGFRHRSSDCC